MGLGGLAERQDAVDHRAHLARFDGRPDVLADRGQLVDGVELVMKPIAPSELLAKLRELLDRPRA